MENTCFEVIGSDKRMFDFNTIHETIHFSKERSARHLRIVNELGSGKQMYSFVVDRNHPNGNEIHTIFTNGIVIVRNQRTNLLVTELIARPGQIRRYWVNQGKALPIDIYPVLNIARKNMQNGYNNW